MENQDQEIRALLDVGLRMEAIARYREQHGVGFLEAEDAIRQLEGGFFKSDSAPAPLAPLAGPSPSPRAADALLEEIGSLLRVGRKIEAIKQYRLRTGVGLAEAKKAVDALEAV